MSIYHLPLTLDTPAENLALDEALLDAAEAGELPGEVLRIWESRQFFAVLGRSSPAAQEINEEACRRDGVAVLRRVSGGQTVVAGPGCLMYALVLDATARPEFRGVDQIHCETLNRHLSGLRPLAPTVDRAGTSDLVFTDASQIPKKFSGNSLRLRRRWLLYHGTVLYDFPIPRLGDWLGPPARKPEYRGDRSHAEFVANLPASREAIAAALATIWHADKPLLDWPRARTQQLSQHPRFLQSKSCS